MSDVPGPLVELQSSPWGQCLNGDCSVLILADLTDIAGNVWIRDPPSIKGIPLPAIILSPVSPSHSPSQGPISQPDINLRTMVGIVASGERGVVPANLGRRLKWYTDCFRLFAKVSKPFLVDADDCSLLATTVEPGDPRIIEAWQLGFDAEWMQINHWVRCPDRQP